MLIPTLTPELDSEIYPQFGRAASFLIVDTGSMEFDAIPNEWRNLECGSGVKAARLALDQNIEVVISKDCGPKAFAGFRTTCIPIYHPGGSRTGREAIQNFLAGKLKEIHAPTLEGHTSSRKQAIGV